MKNANILAIVLLLVGLGAGFFGGMQYQKSQKPSFGSANDALANQQGRRFGTGQNGNNRSVAGDIVSTDDKSITVKMADGQSKIVLVSGSTQINKTDPGAKSDLTVGQKVLVIGSANSDGSITAQNIQLNPQVRAGSGATPSAFPRK